MLLMTKYHSTDETDFFNTDEHEAIGNADDSGKFKSHLANIESCTKCFTKPISNFRTTNSYKY